jgi:fucose permease
MSESESIISSPPGSGQLALLAHAGFLLIGVVNTLLGPILPMLSAKWQLDDAQAGYLFIAQFAGAMLGSALSSPLIKRLGFLPLLAGGYGVMSVAVACLGVGSWAFGIVAVSGLGISLGLTIPATNLLISEINPRRRAAALNVLNFIWCLGAIISPPLISLLAHDGHLAWPMFGLAGLLAGIALLTAYRSPIDSLAGSDRTAHSHFEQSAARAWLTPYALLTGALVFVYVGTETATGGWVASYARRLDTSAQPFWALASSLFWAGLLMGRAAAPAVLRRVSEGTLVLFSLIVAVTGLVIILASRALIAVSAGAGLAGLGLAAVFPTTFAIFTHHFGARASQLAWLIFVLASLGGAVIPWMVGFVSSYFGELRIGLAVPLLGGVIMIALQFAILAVLARTWMRRGDAR